MVQREKKDIAHAVDIYPVIIANPIFRNMHKELIYNVGRHMEMLDDNRTLLILGLSPVASPYGDNKKWFFDMMGPKGKVIAIDYNVKVVAKALAYLSKKGFFEKGEYKPQVIVNSEDSISFLLENGFGNFISEKKIPVEEIVKFSRSKIIPEDIPAKTILSCEGNLNFGINLTNNSIDCIDATLTLHHVAAYRQQLKYVLQEVYRVLKPGGLFHYGDAFVDMRASEKKINDIMNEFTQLTGIDAVLFDDRDSEWKVYSEYSAPKKYSAVPQLIVTKCRPDTQKMVVEITPDGKIKMPLVEGLEGKMDQLGYKNRELKDSHLEMPLIDQEVDKQHIKNVFEFEDLVRELKKGLYATTKFSPELIDQAIERGDQERDIALKGLIEYFSPKDFLCDLLKEVGFVNLSVELPNKDNYPVDVGAILAYKPK